MSIAERLHSGSSTKQTKVMIKTVDMMRTVEKSLGSPTMLKLLSSIKIHSPRTIMLMKKDSLESKRSQKTRVTWNSLKSIYSLKKAMASKLMS